MLSKFSVKKPYTIFVTVILVILLGVISFSSMTTDLLPSMELPYIVISTTYVGASPEKVESMVTKPIEQAMETISNIENTSSVSNENSSMVILEFASDTNMDSALIEINSKLNLVQSSFQDESIATPMVTKMNPNMLPVMLAAVSVEGKESTQTTKQVKEEILPSLERIEGVASVSGTGFVEDTIKITIQQDKIEEINQKVLENVDEKLAQSKQQLNNAQVAITKGKQELANQSKTQNKKIIEGITQLQAGKDKMKQAGSELASKQSALQLSKSGFDAVISNLSTKLTKLQEEKEKLEKLGDSLTSEQKAKLTILEKTIASTQKAKQETNKKLQEVENALASLSVGKQQLEQQQSQLQEQEKSLQLAQTTLNYELNKATAEIAANETKLQEGLQEFEKAREEAYKQASIKDIITPKMISDILTAQNFSMPAGYLTENNTEIAVKVGDRFNSLEEIKNLTLFSFEIEGLENIKLQDLAQVQIENNSDTTYAKINGEDGIIVTFQKQSNASTADVCKQIKQEMKQIQEKQPEIHFVTLMDQGVYIDIIIQSVLENLMYGAILAIVILFLFLKDIKPTIIIALSIPISLTFAITLMYFTGVTINIISLSGLALGVGMLVDNSIVVIENIYRLRSEGKSVIDSAIEGASSVGGAIIASTLTTVCVFLPIVFVQGISRQLFTDMGLTIAYSLLASLIVALTLVPAMASKMFQRTAEKESKLFQRLVIGYEKLLRFCLNHKWMVVVPVIFLLCLSLFLTTKMGTAFIPEAESSQMAVSLEMPEEISFSQFKDMSNQMIDKLLTISDIETIGTIPSSMMEMGNSSRNTYHANMYLILKEKRELSAEEIEEKIQEIAKQMPEIKVSISKSNMDMSSMMQSGIEMVIKGENTDTLQQISKDMASILQQQEGITEIKEGTGNSSEELRITVDKNKAMKYGLTTATVYSQIVSQLSQETKSTTVSLENKDYPIIVVKPEEEKITTDNLLQTELKITQNKDQETILLEEVASLEKKQSLSSISHQNGTKYVSVTGQIDSDHNIGLVSKEIQKRIQEYSLPEGYTISLKGENETINNSLKDLLKMILLAVVFIYLIMVAQFQSVRLPFIVMFTMPLAFTGGLLALFVTGSEISIIAMLGFLVLAGIVVNNGIVLIDYINQLQKTGMSKTESIILAGKTRLKPILMTALTTILGLLTLSLGMGEGTAMVQPLGIVTVGGLLYATILTLLFIPCIYDVFSKKFKNGNQ